MRIFDDIRKRASEIIDGYTNLFKRRPEIEKLALDRGKICEKCPHLNKTTFYLHCDICGCYIPAKLRSPTSECNLHKWGAVSNENS